MALAHDVGLTIGMSLWFEVGVEEAARSVAAHGFEAIEVFHGQIGPRMLTVGITPTHAGLAGEAVRAAGLQVSTLNCAGHPEFDPLERPEEATTLLTEHLRWADAMGSPRVLIWDGITEDPSVAASASARVAKVIDQARADAGLKNPPEVSVELHPYTFVLQHRQLGEFARMMREVGAGICLDFCHFGVAWGQDFLSQIDGDMLDAVNHIHYSDTDCKTRELHFPPGRGVLDLDAILDNLAGRSLSAAWDLFSWPRPIQAITDGFETYRRSVAKLAS